MGVHPGGFGRAIGGRTAKANQLRAGGIDT